MNPTITYASVILIDDDLFLDECIHTMYSNNAEIIKNFLEAEKSNIIQKFRYDYNILGTFSIHKHRDFENFKSMDDMLEYLYDFMDIKVYPTLESFLKRYERFIRHCDW